MRKVKGHLIELLFLVLIIAALLCTGFMFTAEKAVASGRFFSNASINGVDISGLTSEEAIAKLIEEEKKDDTMSIPVVCDGVEKIFTSEDAGVDFDSREKFENIVKNIEGSDGFFDRLNKTMELNEGVYISTEIYYDKEVLVKSVNQFAGQFEVKPVDAKAEFDPQTCNFSYVEDVSGVFLDTDMLLDLIWQRITEKDNSPINISTETKQAGLRLNELKNNTALIASCTTELIDNDDRNHNIELISEAINGLVLQSGGECSLNDLTGERTVEKGYRDAPAIVGGKLIDDTGGGVCQLASTLYYAALMADAEILERHRHTWPSDYLDVGLDASIDYASGKDFIFRNASDTPMYISAIIEGDKLHVKIFGSYQKDGLTIKIVAETLETEEPGEPQIISDPNLPEGQREQVEYERKGYRTRVFRQYYDKYGELVDSQVVSKDNYPAVKAVYKVGTKKNTGNK